MEDIFLLITRNINQCLLSKLAKDYYEKDFHAEYRKRNIALENHFQQLLSLLNNIDFRNQSQKETDTLSLLLILYLELKCTGPWNTEETKHEEYAKNINDLFMDKYGIQVNVVMEKDILNKQVIFDKCIEVLHMKMTINDFKKYPSLIEVYCLLVNEVKSYKIKINPVAVLPAALLLIDDFITSNKIKGLQSCTTVLQSLTPEDFTVGNYYEVVYSSLKKNITEKNKEVTQALFQCFIAFLKLVSENIKKNKLDDIFASLVDQLLTETNLYRKADHFIFTTKIIEMHGIHCVKKKVFKDIVRENLDICSNDSVYEILLQPVLECHQMWIRHCWCTWKLSADHKILTSLFKILYLAKDDATRLQVQNLILTLIKLCSQEEQIYILENLQEPINCANNDFLTRLNTIKKHISI